MPSTTHKVARALTAVTSGAATVLFGLVLNSRYESTGDWAWNSLPLIGLTISVLWNFLSLLTLSTGSYYFFPRRFHSALEITSALLLLVLGSMSFAYSFIGVKSDSMTAQEFDMEHAGIALLFISCIAHFAFFCTKGKQRDEILVIEEKVIVVEIVDAAPPQYSNIWNKVNPFDDAVSTRSLPLYEVGPLDTSVLDEDDKEANVSVREVDAGDMV